MKKPIIALLIITIIVSLFFVGCNNSAEISTPDEIETTATQLTTNAETVATTNITTAVVATETTVPTTTKTTNPYVPNNSEKVESDNNYYYDYSNDDNYIDTKESQARQVAQRIANATYTIATRRTSNPTDLELVSIAAKLVGEYCATCVYTTEDSDYSTAYGVFVKGVYTCAGSTRALGMVLDCMGYSWTHINENEWTHQWCELIMDGRKGWADAYNGLYMHEIQAHGAGYGEHLSGKVDWFDVNRSDCIDSTTDEAKTTDTYQMLSWRTEYGFDEQMIEVCDSQWQLIERVGYLNGELKFRYVPDYGYTYYKYTHEFL